MNEIPMVEDLVVINLLLYGFDFVEGYIIGQFTRRSVQKHKNTIRLLRYNNHKCYVSNINETSNSFVSLIVTLSSIEHPICNNI